MSKKALIDTLGWGSLLWLIGYLLGILLFFIVPPDLTGWLITPIGTVIALYVLFKKVKSTSLQYYLWIALAWTALAIILDYIFLVQLLQPEDGYNKIDVYVYYILTFLLPLIVGWMKNKKTHN